MGATLAMVVDATPRIGVATGQDPNETRPIGMAQYRVQFAKDILGVPFPVGSVAIARARDAERALRAAEIRFARQYGLDDWRERADRVEVEGTDIGRLRHG